MHSFYLDAIKSFEGYTPSAQWDYAQLSNGYGTKAKFAGEKIDKTEADRRFQAEVASARSIVEKNAPFVDEGTKAALTSLTYNAGDSWTRSGLGEAVRRGDLEQVRDIFQQYNKAGGEVLPGLVSRRAAEALWIGNPDTASGDMLASLTSGQSSTAAAQAELPPIVMAAADTPRADSRPVASLPQSLVRLPTTAESRETVSSDALASLRRLTGHEMLALTALENATGVASPSPAAPSDVSRMMKLDNAHASIASRDDERRNGGQRSV
jgi:lysozyme